MSMTRRPGDMIESRLLLIGVRSSSSGVTSPTKEDVFSLTTYGQK